MIIRFRSEGDRAAFLESLHRDRPDLSGAVKPSYSQASVVLARGTREVLLAIRESAGDRVEVFDDIQFGPCGEAGGA